MEVGAESECEARTMEVDEMESFECSRQVVLKLVGYYASSSTTNVEHDQSECG